MSEKLRMLNEVEFKKLYPIYEKKPIIYKTPNIFPLLMILEKVASADRKMR